MGTSIDLSVKLMSSAKRVGAAEVGWCFAGRIDYREALVLQRQLQRARSDGETGDVVVLLEHPPVITLGRRGNSGHILTDAAELARHNVAVVETNRGGLVTYHGPGQLVGYPIVGLREFAGDAPRFVRGLEEAIIGLLGELGIMGFRHPDHRGVFTAAGKVAAIGVAVSRGVTMHGFALNVTTDLSHYSWIDPCGIGDLGVTSVAALTGRRETLEALAPRIAVRLAEVFERRSVAL
jgi:lipoyl(octanoyl) transferase